MNEESSTRRSMLARALAMVGVGAIAAQAASASPSAAGGPYKVVFQVSDADPKKWGLTLANARNLQEAIGAKNVIIEIVIYGPGIGMGKADSEQASRIAETVQAGVPVLACENTMHAMHLSHDDMIPKVGFVPSGVAHLVKRQAEGYAYIRA